MHPRDHRQRVNGEIPDKRLDLGLATESSGLLWYALDQWRLEASSLLRTPHNLYAHITAVDASFTWDPKIWATGNGWMTYGLTRVVRVPALLSSSG